MRRLRTVWRLIQHLQAAWRQDEGYTLIWVLSLSVVLVTAVGGILYAAGYSRNYVSGAFANGVAAPYQSDMSTEGNYQSIQKQVIQIIDETPIGSGSTPDAALAAVETQLGQEGYTVTVKGSYTDSNGNLHEILQVTGPGGSTINLDVTLKQAPTNLPVTAETNPYPTSSSYTQATGGTYVSSPVASTSGGSPSQSSIDSAEPSSGNYMLSLTDSSGNPSSLSLYQSGSSLTFGSPSGSGGATLDELQTGNINMGSSTLTVNGSLDATSVTVNSGGTATVTGNVVTNSVDLNNGSTLTVNGQLTCSSLQLTGGSQLVVGSEAITGSSSSNWGMELDNNASLTINTDGTIDGGLHLTSGTKLVIQGNLFEQGDIQLDNSANLQVQGNAEIDAYTPSSTSRKGPSAQAGNLTLDGSGSTVTIAQNMCLSGSLTMWNTSTLSVGKQALVRGGTTIGTNGPSFTYQGSLLTSGSCPIPQGGGYRVVSVTQI